jgi:hypothetical protein
MWLLIDIETVCRSILGDNLHRELEEKRKGKGSEMKVVRGANGDQIIITANLLLRSKKF